MGTTLFVSDTKDENDTVEYKLFARKNCGKDPTRADCVLIYNDTKSATDRVEKWINSETSDKDMVYLLELWTGGKLQIKSAHQRTFMVKWVWAEDTDWYTTGYTHQSEQI